MKVLLPIIKKDGSVETVALEGSKANIYHITKTLKAGNDAKWAKAFENLAHDRIKILEKQLSEAGLEPRRGLQ